MTNAKLGKVLCIDDDLKVTRALVWALQKKFEVMATDNVIDGIELVNKHDFDVVISDRSMPDLNGVDFLNVVKRVSPRSMRILLTGYSEVVEIARAVNETEVYRLLEKPWAIGDLVSIVERGVAVARDLSTELDAALEDIHFDLVGAPPQPPAGGVLVIDADPAMQRVVAHSVADGIPVYSATSIAEAIAVIMEQPLALVVSETTVGGIDATRLIQMLKHSQPEIVSIIASSQPRPESMAGLVNQGQIYRFIGKPVNATVLTPIIESALRKHRTLKAVPAATRRHVVEHTSPGTAAELLFDIETIAFSGQQTPLQLYNVARIRAGFYRVFGLDRHRIDQKPEGAPA
jgi:serine/threonine-protein kinase